MKPISSVKKNFLIACAVILIPLSLYFTLHLGVYLYLHYLLRGEEFTEKAVYETMNLAKMNNDTLTYGDLLINRDLIRRKKLIYKDDSKSKDSLKHVKHYLLISGLGFIQNPSDIQKDYKPLKAVLLHYKNIKKFTFKNSCSFRDLFNLYKCIYSYSKDDITLFSSIKTKFAVFQMLSLKGLSYNKGIRIIETNKYNCIIKLSDTVKIIEFYHLTGQIQYRMGIGSSKKEYIEKVLRNIRFKDNP